MADKTLEISKFLKVSRGSVNKWVTTYLKDGLEGLSEKPQFISQYVFNNKTPSATHIKATGIDKGNS